MFIPWSEKSYQLGFMGKNLFGFLKLLKSKIKETLSGVHWFGII